MQENLEWSEDWIYEQCIEYAPGLNPQQRDDPEEVADRLDFFACVVQEMNRAVLLANEEEEEDDNKDDDNDDTENQDDASTIRFTTIVGWWVTALMTSVVLLG